MLTHAETHSPSRAPSTRTRLLYQRQILGYHGCAVERFEAAVLRGVHPPQSTEDYDWLGRGIYFWEHGPQRALEWAQSKCRREDRDPADARVLGAVIQLGSCLDLLDVHATRLLGEAYPAFEAALPADSPVPTNTTVASRTAPTVDDVLIRRLDRAVIEFAVDIVSPPYQTVRGAFWEGGPAFPNSAIQTKSHIQIAVRDTSCINGYFNGHLLMEL